MMPAWLNCNGDILPKFMVDDRTDILPLLAESRDPIAAENDTGRRAQTMPV